MGVEISGEQDQIRLAEKMISDLKSTDVISSVNQPSTNPHTSSSQTTSSASFDDWTSNTQQSSQKPSWEQERRTNSERWERPAFEATKRQNSSFEPREKRQSQPFGDALIIKVPSGSVGRIIGRGGSKINELQEQSGARIKVQFLLLTSPIHVELNQYFLF